MMARLRTVALLVVAALVASGCAVLGGGGGTYEVVAFFPRAVALYESGAVQVLGLPAGTISEVEVVGDQVRVTLSIDDDVPLPVDVQAALVPQSLIGERRVQLFPPFRDGDELAVDGHVIPAENTVIPVEPDEALAAVKEFLDSLDPDGLGRLIDNAATTLDGQGESLGTALDELSTLVTNLEENDDDIIRIAERFDDFASTLLSRESQLADVIDDFAVLADVLAAERRDIEVLVSSLADLSVDGLDLVSEHAVRLRTDVAILERLTSSVQVNLGSIEQFVEAGPAIAEGFLDAYNEDLRATDLRNSFSPLVAEALKPVFDAVGVPVPCLPVDVACDDAEAQAARPLAAAGAVPADLTATDRPDTPIDDILAALGSRTTPSMPARQAPAERPSLLDELLGTFLGVGR